MAVPVELAPLIDDVLGSLAAVGDPEQAIAQAAERVGLEGAQALVHACVQVIACVQGGETQAVAFGRLQELGIAPELADVVIERMEVFGGDPNAPVLDAELRDGVGIIHFDGAWNDVAADQFDSIAELFQAVLGDTRLLVFSLERMSALDPAVLTRLLGFVPELKRAGGAACFATAPEASRVEVEAVARSLGGAEPLTLFPTLAAAVASYAGQDAAPVELAAPPS